MFLIIFLLDMQLYSFVEVLKLEENNRVKKQIRTRV